MSEAEPVGFHSSQTGPQEGRCLVVVVHGWNGARHQMDDVVQAVRQAYAAEPGLDIHAPALDHGKLFSVTPAARIVSRLLDDIDNICRDKQRYGRIVLIGFSMGAVIVRRLFLAATDVHKEVPNEPELANAGLRHWAHKIERIVTLAGLNRGWMSSGRLSWFESWVAGLIALTGHLWLGASKPTIFEVRRGAPFIVQTRLQWLALRQSTDPGKPEPLVIQLLGTQDNLVAPDDAIDFAVDRDPANPYFYLELPQSRHDNAFVFSPSRSDRDGTIGAARSKRFREALTNDKATLIRDQIPSDYLADMLPSKPDLDVAHVAFVIHGIRDDGYWTRKIAQRIREKAVSLGRGSEQQWRCETSSYGYFAMLPFVMPWVRRQKVEWLMDQYVGVKARFPRAEFSYVGHSNGTYLVARALQDYPAVRFRHVLFAGSVVRRGYDWAALLAANRVRKVLNMVATRDWVVALFPKGLEPFRGFFDLGGAGFAGFDQARPPKVPNLDEVRYVDGSHSAALVETQWSRIADFIVDGTIPPDKALGYKDKQARCWVIASKVSTGLLVGAAIALVVGVPALILHPIFAGQVAAGGAALLMILLVLYFIGLRFIVTRV